MSELAVVSIVVSLAVMLSQVMAVESAELQRLQCRLHSLRAGQPPCMTGGSKAAGGMM